MTRILTVDKVSVQAGIGGYKVGGCEINPIFTAEQALKVIEIYREERKEYPSAALTDALRAAAISSAGALQLASMFVASATTPLDGEKGDDWKDRTEHVL